MTTRKSRLAALTALLVLITVSLTPHSGANREESVAHAAEFLRLDIPALTHGFQQTLSLPHGDLFLLPQPVKMAILDAPEGTEVFAVTPENFGGEAQSLGALPTTEPRGMALSTPLSRLRAITCAESVWDGNLLIASRPGSDGDKVRLFLEQTDGSAGPDLATFTVQYPGIVVTDLHPHMMMFVNNRKAMGPSAHVGDFIPFSRAAGESGYRTELLTLSWPMGFVSPLHGCFRIGIEISRANNPGRTSVVVTDFVVNRNRTPGDENNPGVGLLGGLTGGYPTGLPCAPQCPFPTQTDPSNPSLANCDAICFRSPQYFLLNLDRLPQGVVLIGGVNHNRPVSTTNLQTIALALRGGFSPLQKLNQEFVAAQLNLLNAGGDGSSKVFHAMEGKLSCYGLNFNPITLSDGFEISPNTKLKDLYQQTRFCIFENKVEDMPTLTRIFDLLNGNNPLAFCNNP
jgi:hypothetical protein